MKNSEICVPTKALALDGEQGAVNPAVGDEVDFSGTATVTRIEGDQAYLAPKTINGEALASEAAPEGEPSLDDEETALRNETKKSDRIY